jgi:hypothetical protein
VRFDRGELKIVNEDAFEARFIDLFKRHIKLPIGDWAKGKVFRPQWGLYGVAGLTSTFRILKDEWGINVDPNLTISVQDGITGVLKAAENTIIELQGESSSEELSRKLKSIQDVLAELN